MRSRTALAIAMLTALGCDAPAKPAARTRAATIQECDAAAPAPAIDAAVAPADPPELEYSDATRWTLGPYELFRGATSMRVRRGDREADLPVPYHAGLVAVGTREIRFGYMPETEEVVTAFTLDQLEGYLVYAHG